MLIRVLGFIMLAAGIVAAPVSIVAACFAGLGWGVYFALIATLCLYCGKHWSRK